MCRKIDSVGTGYYEYDSSATGNVEAIRNLSSLIDLTAQDWRVVVFDEIHVASKAAQSALLKLIEEGSSKTFFLFCLAGDGIVSDGISKYRMKEYQGKRLQDRLGVVQTKGLVAKGKQKVVEVLTRKGRFVATLDHVVERFDGIRLVLIQ